MEGRGYCNAVGDGDHANYDDDYDDGDDDDDATAADDGGW